MKHKRGHSTSLVDFGPVTAIRRAGSCAAEACPMSTDTWLLEELPVLVTIAQGTRVRESWSRDRVQPTLVAMATTLPWRFPQRGSAHAAESPKWARPRSNGIRPSRSLR